MFRTLAALTLVLPFVSALTLDTPKSNSLSSGGPATISWTTAAGDPSTFTLELSNTVFHNSYAIANNVNPSTGSISLALPIVPPGDGYTIIAVEIGNIGNVYATTGSFSIAEQSSSSAISSSSSASGSASASGSGSASASGKSGSTSSSTTIAYTPPATSSGFGHTVTTTPAGSTGFGTTAAATSGAASGSSSASGSAASPSISGSFNAGSSLRFGFNAGSVAVVLLSAVAGMALTV